MPDLVAALRRPIYPRPVSVVEQFLAGLGARFDDFMVRLWMRGDCLSTFVDPVLQIGRAHV